MGWYFLQAFIFAAVAWSSVYWYVPGAGMTAKDAAVVAVCVGIAAAFGVTMLASAILRACAVHRRKNAGAELFVPPDAPRDAREGVSRLDRQP